MGQGRQRKRKARRTRRAVARAEAASAGRQPSSGAMPGRVEGAAQGADDQAAYQRRVAEPHLGLCRMHVTSISAIGPSRNNATIGCRSRASTSWYAARTAPTSNSVAHRPPVDDEVLVARRARLRVGRPTSPVAGNRRERRRSGLRSGELAAEQCREPASRYPRQRAAARRAPRRRDTVKATRSASLAIWRRG